MTISTEAIKTIALGNGTATQFAFPFVAGAAAYIEAIFTDASGNETELIQGPSPGQFQVSLNAAAPGALWGVGGAVNYTTPSGPIASGTTLTIYRAVPDLQAVSLSNQGNLSSLAKSAESAIDLVDMQVQQLAEAANRVLSAPIVDPATISLTLPAAAQRANTGLAFDGSGNVIAGTTPATGLISTAMQPVVDAATVALGRAALGIGSTNLPQPIRTIASGTADTATINDFLIKWNSSASGIKVETIPSAAAAGAGVQLCIKDMYGNSAVSGQYILVQPASGTIDGNASAIINIGKGALWIISDGVSDWTIVA